MIYYRINELYHHGILGQKWGIRRYQNEDGTLTPEGKKRYASMIKDAEEYSISRAIVEDMNRALTKGVTRGNQILVDTDTKKQFHEAIKVLEKMESEMSKKYSTVINDVYTKDGKDYIRTILYDKNVNEFGVERLTELHNQYKPYSK